MMASGNRNCWQNLQKVAAVVLKLPALKHFHLFALRVYYYSPYLLILASKKIETSSLAKTGYFYIINGSGMGSQSFF